MLHARSRISLGLFFVGLIAALHCGTTGGDSEFGDGDDPCKTVFAGKCGLPCGVDLDCESGMHCGIGNTCTAQCAPGKVCENGVLCSPRGRCGTDDVPPVFGDSGIPKGDATVPDAICADVDVALTKVLPKVLFLLDQSSSMHYFKFPDGDSAGCNPDCRWTVLKDVMIGKTAALGGVVKTLQAEAELGVLMYSATDPTTGDGDDSFLPPPTDAVCPRFNGKAFPGVSFKLNNAAAIDALLRPATVDDDTPTGPAVRTAAGLAADGGVSDPKGFAAVAGNAPKVLVLVTDGEPATCGGNLVPSQAGRDESVKAVQDTYKQKIRTFVIAIGGAAGTTHLQNVANAGQGFDPDTGDAGVIKPQTPQQLVDALKQIVLDARTCTFMLNGVVKAGQEKLGVVTLNGATVPLQTPGGPEEGWKLKNASTIELLGTACKTLKETPNATLNARFPCDAVQDLPR